LIPTERWPCLVTYADEMEGHTGRIYRADNWEYMGQTTAEAAYRIDGQLRARKAGQKTYTHAEMLARGAVFLGRFKKYKFRLLRTRG